MTLLQSYEAGVQLTSPRFVEVSAPAVAKARMLRAITTDAATATIAVPNLFDVRRYTGGWRECG